MDGQMKNYIFYEIGNTCKSEFMMEDGQFHRTEDAVVIGISNGKSPQTAFERLALQNPYIKKYKIDRVVAREICEAVYL